MSLVDWARAALALVVSLGGVFGALLLFRVARTLVRRWST